MMRILRLLGQLVQQVKKSLSISIGARVITTPAFFPLPTTINNDLAKAGSFLFAEDGTSQESGSQSQESPNLNREKGRSVNDELALENNPRERNESPRWLVNDDLAACVRVGRQGTGATVGGTGCTTNNFWTKPYSNGPARAGSFAFLGKSLFKKFFTAINEFQKPVLMKRAMQLIPVRHSPITSNNFGMKKIVRRTGLSSLVLTIVFLGATIAASATNYFSGSNGDPTNTNIWWTNTNGTGGHPTVFTNAGDVFTIQNGHTLTNVTNNWTLAGSLIIQSGGALALTAANGTYSVGSLTINSGGSATINRQFTVGGATSISGSVSFASTSGTTRPMLFSGDVTLNSGASWTEATNGNNGQNDTYSFSGNFTNNASSFSATNNALATHTFTGTGMSLSGSTAFAIPFVTVNGTYTNNGTLTVSGILAGSGTLTNSATGTLNLGGTITVTNLAATTTGNIVNYTGAAQTLKGTGYATLNLSNTGLKTFSTGLSVSGNLSITNTTVALGNSNYTTKTLSINGVGQPAGTFGSTASAATFKPAPFGSTGSGILTVTQQSCVASTISGNLTVCAGLTTQLNASDPPAASNPWVSGTTTVATVTNTGLVSGVSAGSSVITFTNSSGCVNTATVTVNPTPTTSFTKNDVQCFNTSTGQITVTASGGSGTGYTYSIFNGVAHPTPPVFPDYQSGNVFSNLPAGTYQVRVKDSNGCQSKSVQ